MNWRTKNWLFVGALLIFAAWLLILAFYTYGELTYDAVDIYSVEIINADIDYTHRKTWLILQTSDNETFYCRIDTLPKSVYMTIAELKEKKSFPFSAVVACTNRKNLLPTTYIELLNYKYLVSLDMGNDVIIDLEQHNQVNAGLRYGLIVASIIIVLFSLFVVALLRPRRPIKGRLAWKTQTKDK